MPDAPKCNRCGRFMTWPPAQMIPVRDAVHPYTADYEALCDNCATKEETQ